MLDLQRQHQELLDTIDQTSSPQASGWLSPRGVHGLRQAALDSRRHHLRADQDRAGPVVPGDLSGDLEQGRDLGDGAGLRQLPDRLELAAQDPKGDGAAGSGAAERAGRGRRDLCRRPQAGQAGARRGRQDEGRRARSRAAAARIEGAGRRWGGCAWPWSTTSRPRASRASSPAPSPRRRPVATDGWSGYRGLDAAGYRHEPHNLSATSDDAASQLPAIHLVFGLAKRWLLGTHHGAVGKKHLPAYLDEFVFRFNRRTAKNISHRFARVNAEEEGAGKIRVPDREIDEEPPDAQLRDDLVAQPRQTIGDRDLEVAIGLSTRRPAGIQALRECVLQVCTQDARPLSGRLSYIDPLWFERREQDHLVPGPREQNVESPMPVPLADRSEVLDDPPVGIGAIDRRYGNHITFIALDVLQILDEKMLECSLPALPIRVRNGIALEHPLHLIIDEVALQLIDRDDPQRPVISMTHEITRPGTCQRL